ncbi:hypothetical protein H9P43_007187 [Blastocladiella emersonii ATCC 22665]|nr:hypothetical protein H9P43_007187 [Blastocladiella emersonii ATCC 22665]
MKSTAHLQQLNLSALPAEITTSVLQLADSRSLVCAASRELCTLARTAPVTQVWLHPNLRWELREHYAGIYFEEFPAYPTDLGLFYESLVRKNRDRINPPATNYATAAIVAATPVLAERFLDLALPKLHLAGSDPDALTDAVFAAFEELHSACRDRTSVVNCFKHPLASLVQLLVNCTRRLGVPEYSHLIDLVCSRCPELFAVGLTLRSWIGLTSASMHLLAQRVQAGDDIDISLVDFLGYYAAHLWAPQLMDVLRAEPRLGFRYQWLVEHLRDNAVQLFEVLVDSKSDEPVDDIIRMHRLIFGESSSGLLPFGTFFAQLRSPAVLRYALARSKGEFCKSTLSDWAQAYSGIVQGTPEPTEAMLEALDENGLVREHDWAHVLWLAIRKRSNEPARLKFVVERLGDRLAKVLQRVFILSLPHNKGHVPTPPSVLAVAHAHLSADAFRPFIVELADGVSDLAISEKPAVVTWHGQQFPDTSSNKLAPAAASAALAAIFSSNKLPDGALWPMFVFANAFVSRYGPLECTALAWVPIAALRNPPTRDRARELIRAEETASLLLASMIYAQLLDHVGIHPAVRLTSFRTACRCCDLSNQRVWLRTLDELIALDPAAVRHLPLSLGAEIRTTFAEIEDLAQLGARDELCHGACETVVAPMLSAVRLLLSADLAGFLDVLTGGKAHGRAVPFAVWRAVDDGLYDLPTELLITVLQLAHPSSTVCAAARELSTTSRCAAVLKQWFPPLLRKEVDEPYVELYLADLPAYPSDLGLFIESLVVRYRNRLGEDGVGELTAATITSAAPVLADRLLDLVLPKLHATVDPAVLSGAVIEAFQNLFNAARATAFVSCLKHPLASLVQLLIYSTRRLGAAEYARVIEGISARFPQIFLLNLTVRSWVSLTRGSVNLLGQFTNNDDVGDVSMTLANFLGYYAAHLWAPKIIDVLNANPRLEFERQRLVETLRTDKGMVQLLTVLADGESNEPTDDAIRMLDWLLGPVWCWYWERAVFGSKHLFVWLARLQSAAVLRHAIACSCTRAVSDIYMNGPETGFTAILGADQVSFEALKLFDDQLRSSKLPDIQAVIKQIGDRLPVVLKNAFLDSLPHNKGGAPSPRTILALAHAHLAPDQLTSLISDLAEQMQDLAVHEHPERGLGQSMPVFVIKRAPGSASAALAAIFSSTSLPAGALWPMFLLAAAFISRYGPLEYPALAWLPVAALHDPAMRDQARELIRSEKLVPHFLVSMLVAQLRGVVGTHASVKLSAFRTACFNCALCDQQAWGATVAELLAIDVHAVRKVTPGAAVAIRELLGKRSDLANFGARDAPCHGACETVARPALAVVRQLLRADLAGSLDVLAGTEAHGGLVPLSVWRAIDKGALDGVKDEDWLDATYEMVVAAGKVKPRRFLRELRRVAPKSVVSEDDEEAEEPVTVPAHE